MNLHYIEVPESQAAYPDIKISGGKVTVPKFKGRMGTLEFELKEGEEFKATSRPVDTEIFGYIVKDAAGDIHLLVDEVSSQDPPFDFETNGITRLQFVFALTLPANTMEFSGGRVKRSLKEEKHA